MLVISANERLLNGSFIYCLHNIFQKINISYPLISVRSIRVSGVSYFFGKIAYEPNQRSQIFIWVYQKPHCKYEQCKMNITYIVNMNDIK